MSGHIRDKIQKKKRTSTTCVAAVRRISRLLVSFQWTWLGEVEGTLDQPQLVCSLAASEFKHAKWGFSTAGSPCFASVCSLPDVTMGAAARHRKHGC